MTSADGVVRLPHLQNLIKRDKDAYKEEFLMQYRHFQSNLEIFRLKPSAESKHFAELVMFLSHVSVKYPEEMTTFPRLLTDLLEQHYSALNPTIRQTLVNALILLRNRNQVEPVTLLPLFFKLFRCSDKELRKMVFSHIVQDIKRLNKKHKNQAVNRQLQNFMFEMLEDKHAKAAKKSLDVMIELYKKQIWNDAKTVNVISTACLSKDTKLMVTGINFFLGAYDAVEGEDSDDEGTGSVAMKEIIGAKKTKARQNRMKRELSKEKKKQRRKSTDPNTNFAAIDVLNDPQGFAEKMFGKLKSTTEKFEVRLTMMSLISRLINRHKLFLLNFYPYLQKYMQPHQLHVTQILAFFAQACHDLIPPKELQPMVKSIADNFISERCPAEVISVGINTVREICARAPLVMDDTLLQDLAQYKTFKNKSVVMASRGLINLFREINPVLLTRKDRGRQEGEAKTLEYGKVAVPEGVEGIELLQDEMMHDGDAYSDDEQDEEGEEEEDDESMEGWEEVSEDEQVDLDTIDFENLKADNEAPDSDDDDEEEDEEDEGDEEEEAEDGKEKQTSSNSKSLEQGQTKSTISSVRLDAERILGPEDFRRIKILKYKKALEKSNGGRGVKRSREDAEIDIDSDDLENESDDDNTVNRDFVDVRDIESHKARQRADLETRLASVMEGRQGREKFGGKKKNKGGGSTNEEKKKSKPLMMIRQSLKVRSKAKQSIKDKVTNLKAHIKKLKNKISSTGKKARK